MDHSNQNSPATQKKISGYTAFGLIIAGIIGGTMLLQIIRDWHLHDIMADFMGLFFITFGAFKLINYKAFIEAYQTYDIVAKKSKLYAMAYPFIEIGLGIAYLARFLLVPVNIITLVLMIIGSIGVLLALFKKQEFQCACLGTIINLPLTYITLIEDLAMAAMALIMLLI